ncbi:hypothetical protein KAW80_00620 [Candidatus Babeliales bacterium]|nr:hypothetical protein [Candidatus Babeliales bacterium]
MRKYFGLFLALFFIPINTFSKPIELPYTFDAGPLATLVGKEKITVIGQVDLEKKEYSLSSKVLKKQSALGAISIANLKITLSNTTGLGIDGDISLFDKTGNLNIKELTTKRIVSKLTFKKGSELKLPYLNITIPYVEATAEKNKAVIITAPINLFGQRVNAEVKVEKEKRSISFTLPNKVSLTELVKKLDPDGLSSGSSKFANVNLYSLNIKFEQDKNGVFIASLFGKVDLSNLQMIDLTQNTKNLKFSGFILEEKIDKKSSVGFELKVGLDSLTMPLIGDVTDPHIIFRKKTRALAEVENIILAQAPELIADLEKKERYELILGGDVNIQIPGMETVIPLTLQARLMEKRFVLAGKIKNDIMLPLNIPPEGPKYTLKLIDPKFLLSRKYVTFHIAAEADFNALKVNGVLTIDLAVDLNKDDAKKSRGNNKKSKLRELVDYTVEFETKVTSKAPYKPFKDSDLGDLDQATASELRNIELNEAGLKLRTTSQEFPPNIVPVKSFVKIFGKTKMFGSEVNGTIKFFKLTEGNKKAASAFLQFGAKKTFGELFKISVSGPLTNVELDDITVILSSANYREKEEPKLFEDFRPAIKKGFNIYFKFNTQGTLLDNQHAGNIMQDGIPEKIAVSGSISPDFRDFSVGTQLGPFKFKPEDLISSLMVRLEISKRKLHSPEIALKTVISSHDKDFIARVGLNSMDAILALTMKGAWENAIGLKGFTLEDVAAAIYFNYLVGFDLEGGGFTAKVYLGDKGSADAKIIKFAFNYNKYDPSNTILLGKMAGNAKLCFKEIVELFIDKIPPIPEPKTASEKQEKERNRKLSKDALNKLPELCIRDVELVFAPTGGRIGDIYFDQGYTVAGKVDMHYAKSNWKGEILWKAQEAGFRGKADLDPMYLGPVWTTANPNTTGINKGPILDIELGIRATSHFKLDAGVSLLKIVNAGTTINISKTGFDFDISGKIFERFQASIQCISDGSVSDPDVKFKASLKNDFDEEIIRELRNSIAPKGPSWANLHGFGSFQKLDEALGLMENLSKVIGPGKTTVKGSLKDIEKGKLVTLETSGEILGKKYNLSLTLDAGLQTGKIIEALIKLIKERVTDVIKEKGLVGILDLTNPINWVEPLGPPGTGLPPEVKAGINLLNDISSKANVASPLGWINFPKNFMDSVINLGKGIKSASGKKEGEKAPWEDYKGEINIESSGSQVLSKFPRNKIVRINASRQKTQALGVSNDYRPVKWFVNPSDKTLGVLLLSAKQSSRLIYIKPRSFVKVTHGITGKVPHLLDAIKVKLPDPIPQKPTFELSPDNRSPVGINRFMDAAVIEWHPIGTYRDWIAFRD